MILFINVFLSSGGSALGMGNSRYRLPNFSKQDIFLYTLESYKLIPWFKVIIYCELEEPDETYHDKIRELFPTASIYKKRCARQGEWQDALVEVFNEPDELVWYAGNHDHPYLAPNHDQLNRLVAAIQADPSPLKGGCYSHFYETCRIFMQEPGYKWQWEGNGVSSFLTHRTDAMLIMSKDLLRSWWFDTYYGDRHIPRSDWVEGVIGPEFRCYQPVSELCRHFDGYDLHGNIFAPNDIPPISIPEGFWTSEIKLSYGSAERRQGLTWVNPINPLYAAIDASGADLRCLLEDLPLFWQDRIKDVEHHHRDPGTMKEARNQVYYEAATARHYNETRMLSDIWYRDRKDYRPPVPDYYLKWLFLP
jgi:hypothetical protein